MWWRGGAIGAGGAAGAVHDEDDEADSGDEASNNNATASSSSSSSSSSSANPGGADDSSRFTFDRYDARNLIESAAALRKFRRFAQQHRAIDESGAAPRIKTDANSHEQSLRVLPNHHSYLTWLKNTGVKNKTLVDCHTHFSMLLNMF